MNDNGNFEESHIDSLFEYKGCTCVLLYVGNGEITKDWYCAYTLLPKKPKYVLNNQTWGEKTKEAGIDTQHFHNFKMSVKDKRKDAVKQIKQLIDDFFGDD